MSSSLSSLLVARSRAATILALAAPIVVAMLTQTSINVVDTYFIGTLDPGVATPGQAALGFALPLLWIFGGAVSALGVGAQVMTARREGSVDREGAGRIIANTLAVGFVAGLVTTAFAWAVTPRAFAFLTPNASIQELGVPYARLRLLGVVGMVLSISYKGFFDGLGRTRVHMYAAITMNLANVGLNVLFIFGYGPIPAYGVTGAGIASVVSTFIGLAFMAAWSLGSSHRPYRIYRWSNLSGRTSWEVVKLSVPSGVAQIFIMSGVLMFLKIVSMLDAQAATQVADALAGDGGRVVRGVDEALRESGGLGFGLVALDWSASLASARPPIFSAAAKLIIDLLSVGFVTCIAFGTATATLVSQSLGRAEYGEAAAYGWDSVKIGMYLYGGIGLAVILWPEVPLGWLSSDPLVVQTAIPGLQIMAGLEMFVAMALILTQALFGAGDTKFVMIVEMVLHGLSLAPLAYLFSLVLGFGFLGVWFSGTLYLFLLAAVMAVKFKSGTWTEIKV